jgi:hypothetical protein
MERLGLSRPDLLADTIPVEIAIVRQPLGEPLLDHELWREADEQVVPLEMRGLLEANGFRCGTISGAAPPALQRLLSSPRSCTSTQLAAIRARRPLFLPLGSKDVAGALKVVHDGDTLAHTYEQAQCGLSLELRVSDEGELVLHFEPRVRHGRSQLTPCPATDRSDWTLLAGQPEEKYPRLAWQVSLTANEYVLIGGLPSRLQTLGYWSFIRATEETPSQELLVIRATRTPNPSPFAGTVTSLRVASLAEPVPLALQSIATKPRAVTRGQSAPEESP